VDEALASIVKKMKKGHAYYYLVESARVNGKPRIVNQRYLGTAESIGAAFNAAANNIPNPEYSKVLNFGAVAALYDLSERLGLRQIIDRYAGKRIQGLPVSDSIILAAINRAVLPSSKSGFYSWFENTVLPNVFSNANSKNLSSQGFWNNMKQLNQDRIRLIEDEITRMVARRYEISTDCLLFDNTNFFTYIDTNTPAKLAKRGKSKEKRTDLKIVGLSMMVSPDHSVPLFHETYPGNDNDSKQFATIIDKLKNRFGKLGVGGCRVTLVFDKGNNSKNNIEAVMGDQNHGFDFVGGLKFNQCPEFNTIGLEHFCSLDGTSLEKTIAYRVTKHIYGRDLTVILTYNQALYDAQLDGVRANIERCTERLNALQQDLEERYRKESPRGKSPTKASVEKKIDGILSVEHMKTLFIRDVQEGIKGRIRMSTFFDNDAFEKLKTERLGRSILITNHDDWTTERIISAYRSQYHIEDAFRRMKDTKYLSFRPIHHFTDSNIRVHAFYCVLALLLASLMNKKLEQMGHPMSIHKMLDRFQELRQVITVFPDNDKKRRTVSSFSEMDEAVKKYIDLHDLTKISIKL
jgi:transposase